MAPGSIQRLILVVLRRSYMEPGVKLGLVLYKHGPEKAVF